MTLHRQHISGINDDFLCLMEDLFDYADEPMAAILGVIFDVLVELAEQAQKNDAAAIDLKHHLLALRDTAQEALSADASHPLHEIRVKTKRIVS
jgi:hypothetical protein